MHLRPAKSTTRAVVVGELPGGCDLVAAMLRTLGYQAAVFTDPLEALTAFERERNFSFLVTDMHMPVLSGFELAARARRYRGKLPVLYLSGQLPAGFCPRG
jgi:CheY-like chemotaxis protein